MHAEDEGTFLEMNRLVLFGPLIVSEIVSALQFGTFQYHTGTQNEDRNICLLRPLIETDQYPISPPTVQLA